MRTIIIPLLFISLYTFSQQNTSLPVTTISEVMLDSLIKDQLVALALKGPSLTEATSQESSAKYELKKAQTSWLNSIVMSGNINEFVINNTTINGVSAATLFPKYNFGVNIPLGLFSSQEKHIAKQKVNLYKANKEGAERALKKEVLVRYENYKEKKELFELQKQLTDGQYRSYQQRQKEFASREINKLEDVNKEFEQWVEQRSKQRTKERDLKVAELELEELIGMPIAEAIQCIIPNK